MAPHGVYPCAGQDQWLAVACADEIQWRGLCGVVDGMPKAEGLDERRVRADEIDELICGWTRERGKEQAAEILQGAGVSAGPVNSAPDMLADVPADQRWLVSCEGAFSYLAQDLGLQELYLWPVNADELATPQQIRRVIDAVRAQSIPVIFCESTVPNAPALQVARETGARFGGVLYVDSLSAAEGPVPSYLDLLRVTIETIAAGLSGAGTAQ